MAVADTLSALAEDEGPASENGGANTRVSGVPA